jgi:AhpD family alkylhydroperoxidase
MSEVRECFKAFENSAFADGLLSAKIKEIMAVAIAHVTNSPRCIDGHVRRAVRLGATDKELIEAIWVAAAMRAGGSLGGGGDGMQAVISKLVAMHKHQPGSPT